MKKMKQWNASVTRMISACMAAIIIFAAVPVAAAVDYSPAPPTPVVSVSNTGVAPAADDTEWVFRFHEGKWQMRCWSHTQARWLTDWIDCE